MPGPAKRRGGAVLFTGVGRASEAPLQSRLRKGKRETMTYAQALQCTPVCIAFLRTGVWAGSDGGLVFWAGQASAARLLRAISTRLEPAGPGPSRPKKPRQDADDGGRHKSGARVPRC